MNPAHARLPAGQVHFLLGAMKCGTSSLYVSLKSHPGVCRSRVKEPQFFSHEKIFRRGPDWYLDQWPDWNPDVHQVALDATTSHTKFPWFPRSPARIQAFNPAARLIYLVRDPFERLQSHYRMSLALGWNLTPLDRGVDPYALAISLYDSQLRRYREYFRREALLVLDLADLSARPAHTLSRICDHLNLPGSPGLSLGKVHVSEEEYPSAASPDRYTLMGKNRDQAWRTLAPDMKHLQREYGIDIGRWGFP
ncbi:MAG: hypothetical protein K0Q91_550 [Fibrobacteria bacterium]|nr:hypothetical protein [Fibrobacteria bacterium]